jgi:hypothetical protein
MFGDGCEQSTILRTGPDGLTRVITRTSWAERELVLVEAREAELLVSISHLPGYEAKLLALGTTETPREPTS